MHECPTLDTINALVHLAVYCISSFLTYRRLYETQECLEIGLDFCLEEDSVELQVAYSRVRLLPVTLHSPLL